MKSAIADVIVDREAISRMLVELGVDLSHNLAAAIVMGAADVLIALEIAESMPAAGDYQTALGELYSFSSPVAAECPSRVVEAQQLLLDAALQDASCASIDPGRLAVLRARIEARVARPSGRGSAPY